MSFPTIPHICPKINLNRTQVIDLLMASIAFEELGLAHIINAEGEKLQAALGTLGLALSAGSLTELVALNREVRRTLQTVLKSQMLLQIKLEDIVDINVPQIPVCLKKGSAWADGCCYGHGKARYMTLSCNKREKTVKLEIINKSISVGKVKLLGNKNILAVTFITDSPYFMDQVHLYVSNTVPTNSDPGSFPYQYTAIGPSNCFTTYTFNIDVSAFTGNKLYVAAHANILQGK